MYYTAKAEILFFHFLFVGLKIVCTFAVYSDGRTGAGLGRKPEQIAGSNPARIRGGQPPFLVQSLLKIWLQHPEFKIIY